MQGLLSRRPSRWDERRTLLQEDSESFAQVGETFSATEGMLIWKGGERCLYRLGYFCPSSGHFGSLPSPVGGAGAADAARKIRLAIRPGDIAWIGSEVHLPVWPLRGSCCEVMLH